MIGDTAMIGRISLPVWLLRAGLCGLLLTTSACQAERDPGSPGEPGADEAWLEAENLTDSEIVELNLAEAPVIGEAWGINQLGELVFAPSSEFRLREIPCPQVYDLRAIGADTAEAVRFDAAFACGDAVPWIIEQLE